MQAPVCDLRRKMTMGLFGSRNRNHSGEEISTFLSLHNRYCDLLAKTSPNTAALHRKRVTSAVVGSWSTEELDRRRNQVIQQSEWLTDELALLETGRIQMDQLAQMQQDVQQWATEYSANLKFLIIHHSTHRDVP